MKIQKLQQEALSLCLELEALSNEEYKAEVVKSHYSPTLIIEYFNRGSERFQLWVNQSYTEYYQKQYLERNIVRLGQIKKELFGG